jgi:hypothetical protein
LLHIELIYIVVVSKLTSAGGLLIALIHQWRLRGDLIVSQARNPCTLQSKYLWWIIGLWKLFSCECLLLFFSFYCKSHSALIMARKFTVFLAYHLLSSLYYGFIDD